MKFSINQSELQNALSVVLKGIATRSTLPILSGIYLDAHDDTLTLQATDLELSIQYSVSALIEETGKAVVPGKLFSEIVKNLPDAAVHVAAEDDSAVITCDTASFSIKTLDAEDFPGFPHVDVQQEVSIPFTQFASMVKRVARVVSKDESRAILTGVLITLEDTTLRWWPRLVSPRHHRGRASRIQRRGVPGGHRGIVLAGDIFAAALGGRPQAGAG